LRHVVADPPAAEFARDDRAIDFRLRCSFTSQRAALPFASTR
jgi:hypothetical protein